MKKIGIMIIIVGVFVFAFGFGVSKYNSTSADIEKVYSMQEALSTEFHTATFDVEEKSLEMYSRKYDTENSTISWGKELSFSKEDEQKLIQEIEQFELVEYDGDEMTKALFNDTFYQFYLTIGSRYYITVDSKSHTIYLQEHLSPKAFTIKNGDKFFTLLEQIKNATTVLE